MQTPTAGAAKKGHAGRRGVGGKATVTRSWSEQCAKSETDFHLRRTSAGVAVERGPSAMRVGGDGASLAAAGEIDAGAAVSARLDLSVDSDGRRCQEAPCGQKRGGRKGNEH